MTASTERVGLVVRVEDAGSGFRVVALPDPRIKATLADGVVLRGDTLCPAAPAGLSGRELEDLTRGQVFEAGEVARLVTELLPSLRGRLPVEIATTRLPRTVELPPRIRLEVSRDGEALDVLPTLVYGDPPVARVDAGRLVSLGGPVPLRDEAGERRVVAQLAQDLELLPGHRVRASGAEAIKLAARLSRFAGEIRGDAHRSFVPAAPLTPSLRVGAEDFELAFDSAPAAQADPLAEPIRAACCAPGTRARATSRSRAVGSRRCPRIGSRATASRSRTCSPHAANGACCRAARCPDLARLCDALEAPRPPAFEALRALVEGFEGLPHAPRPADLRATLRHYQEAGSRLALLPAGRRPRRSSRRRHGPRQDPPGAVRRARAHAGGGADERALQLGRGDRALPAGAARLALPRPGPRSRPGGRRHAHELRTPASGCRCAHESEVGYGDPRRGPDDQESGQPGRARRAPARRRRSG